MTQNIEERIKRHNDGRERTTKFYRPFELIFRESCKNRPEARLREKYWKTLPGVFLSPVNVFNLLVSKLLSELFIAALFAVFWSMLVKFGITS